MNYAAASCGVVEIELFLQLDIRHIRTTPNTNIYPLLPNREAQIK